ncbi:hypothetical protein EON63_00150 [archaeon]|nr:MAG: hypothetical protein EON63_00150 [archaeon]
MDDFEFISNNNCTALTWPKELQRDTNFPFNILPYNSQPYYWPDSNLGPYFGIFQKDWTKSPNSTLQFENQAAHGTPIVPYAATGLRQYAQKFIYSFNSTHNGFLYEYCTSVFGEPTRGRTVDGFYGRASKPVLIAQPRPQRPGWDGCRDRYDVRTDLPQSLQYVHPRARYGHRAIFHENTSEIIFYGGQAYLADQAIAYRLEKTFDSAVQSDMWYYNLDHCVNNCTGHGDCYYGFCFCFVGYYGVDCSNTSCPGTFCHYDPISHEQICTHACQAAYNHTDNDTYVQDIAKIPCSIEHPGESNGICDGFGTTMCAPPFITQDCSVKDCPKNCSFNGWCSVEFPVSRCMCQPGYFGDICDQKLCLNNCSYPNGVCNTTSGMCACNMMYSPYLNTREFKPWDGEDCSYLFPYAAGMRGLHVASWMYVVMVGVAIVLGMDALTWVGARETGEHSGDCSVHLNAS